MQETVKDNLQEESASRYIVHIENFDGPLDLLWDLIKKAKIDITEISISRITEQYMTYIRMWETMNIQVASEFIHMASELLYYKSRALLPGEGIEDEFFVPPLPPELIHKLLEYKKFQNASRQLKERFDLQSDSFVRKNAALESGEEEEYIEVSLFDLLNAFAEVIESRETEEPGEIVFDEILVSDRINHIDKILGDKEHILFADVFSSPASRAEIIVTFLAILEMAKMKRIRIMQHRVFGDIRLMRWGGNQGDGGGAGEIPPEGAPIVDEYL